ncbi:MAG: hypothetical protein ABR585_09625 [Gemmatimonadaceae bacterium]
MLDRPLFRACVLLGITAGGRSAVAQSRSVQPVLAFPEAGLDDPAAYQGYQTRFFRDTRGNVVQVYLDARSGRVVTLLADAVDESVGFTVRDSLGKPVRLDWGSQTATISESGSRRTIEVQLMTNVPRIVIGWLQLGSMRVERDLGYSGRNLEPYDWPTFRLREQEELINNLDRLEPDERQRELGMLNAAYPSDIRARLVPDVITTGVRERPGVNVTQASLDGKTNLELAFDIDPRNGSLTVIVPTITLRSNGTLPLRFSIRVTTDAPALTPLLRDQIFNDEFLRFLSDARARAGQKAATPASVARYRQLERDVRGTELLSSKEKLMAGLPNYATYFGRDMMMTSLMMEPIWQNTMAEHVIASALRKLGPNGDVSHEEALGGQAIRENAAEYNAHAREYFRLRGRGNRIAADTALANARALLTDLQKVRENYNMRDDEFQLPILVARYLANPDVTAARKKAFLLDTSDGRGPRVGLIVRELALVASLAEPYARNPLPQNLVGSPRLDSTHWRSISWRDSNAGYANGRFAMDINAIWVPLALRATSDIIASLRELGFTTGQLGLATPRARESALAGLINDPGFFQQALRNWDGAIRHFIVSLSAEDVRRRVQQKLLWLSPPERAYWQRVLSSTTAGDQSFEFTAISLDENGHPIPVANTDPATWLLLEGARDSTSVESRVRALRDVRTFVRPYPVGLLIDRLGPVVANDAYASPSVWEDFRRDTYHSPRVVWGREVNLIMLGLVRQISRTTDAGGRPRDPELTSYVAEMSAALQRINAAVEASGLKHNELWSYEIDNGVLQPIRYGASTDVQLWNVTDLAVQYVLSMMKGLPGRD